MAIVLASFLSIFWIINQQDYINLSWAIFVGVLAPILIHDLIQIIKLVSATVPQKICLVVLIIILSLGSLQSNSFSAPHLFLELTSLGCLLLGASTFRRTYRINGLKSAFQEISLAIIISIILASVGFAQGGLTFSSLESGRSYANDAGLSLKNFLYISVFSFPILWLTSSKRQRLIIAIGSLLYSILTLASGGRSFLLYLAYILITVIVNSWPNIARTKINIKGVLVILSFAAILLVFGDSFWLIIDRSLNSSSIPSLEMKYGMDTRLIEFVQYFENSSFATKLYGSGLGSVTESVLFSVLTNTLHLSYGTIILKAGVIGLIFFVLYILAFLLRPSFSNGYYSLIMILPVIGWFVAIELAHTTFSSPQIMFYLGYFLAFYYYPVSGHFRSVCRKHDSQ